VSWIGKILLAVAYLVVGLSLLAQARLFMIHWDGVLRWGEGVWFVLLFFILPASALSSLLAIPFSIRTVRTGSGRFHTVFFCAGAISGFVTAFLMFR